jgi:hypothetical protein
MRLRLLLVGIALVAGGSRPGLAGAQEEGTGTVIGRVVWCDVDTATERPAGNTLVVAEGTFIGTRTDEAGEFMLRDVPAGPDMVIEALSDDEQVKASRFDVPVVPDHTLDIGVLQLGAPPLTGCMPEPEVDTPA